MRYLVGAATHPGRVRQRNEDAYGVGVPGLYVVCDGMGGEACGDVAAQLAVATVEATFPLRRCSPMCSNCLQASAGAANLAVTDPATNRATTLVMLALPEELERDLHGPLPGWVAWAGDSRCGRLRGGEFRWLTRDHSLVGEEQRRAEAEGREPRPTRTNVVTRALGRARTEVEVEAVDVAPGDVFLLCTDGVWGAFDKTTGVACARDPLWRIKHALTLHWSAVDAADAIVAMAVEYDGSDNATAIVVRVEG